MKRVYGRFCSRHNEAVNFYKDLLTKDKRFKAFIKVRLYIQPLIRWVTEFKMLHHNLLIMWVWLHYNLLNLHYLIGQGLINSQNSSLTRDPGCFSSILSVLWTFMKFLSSQQSALYIHNTTHKHLTPGLPAPHISATHCLDRLISQSNYKSTDVISGLRSPEEPGSTIESLF